MRSPATRLNFSGTTHWAEQSRFRTPLQALSLGLFLLSPIGAGATAVFDLNQVDYYQDGSLSEANSEWGQVNVQYTPGSTLRWFNVVQNPGTVNERWIVQNHPLLPASETGQTSFTSTVFFDWDVSRGTDISGSSVDVFATTSSTPYTSAPTLGVGDAVETVMIGGTQDIINDGVPSTITSLNPGALMSVPWTVPLPTEIKIVHHEGMPNVIQEMNFCGPGAAANSLLWLHDQNDIGLTDTLEEVQSALASAMGNNHDGNWDDAEVQGKLKYIADNDLNLEVHYTGGEKLPTSGNYVDPNGNGAARNDGAISWEWIVDQMMMGQDIELMTATHWVVLETVIGWGDVRIVCYRDDPYQNGGATTAEQEEEISNRRVCTTYDAEENKINIGNGIETLKAAVAESPVPEPGTALLVMMGMAVLAAHGQRVARVRGLVSLSAHLKAGR